MSFELSAEEREQLFGELELEEPPKHHSVISYDKEQAELDALINQKPVVDGGTMEDFDSCFYENNKGQKTKLLPHKTAEYVVDRFRIKTIQSESSKNPQTYLYQDGIYVRGENIIDEYLQKMAPSFLTKNLLREILGHINRMTFCKREAFDSDPYKLVVNNGILNLKTFKLIPHSPEHLSLIKIPCNYNPEADCPKIKDHLNKVFSSPEDLFQWQEFCGYTLFNGLPFKKAMQVVGKADSGKTTSINIHVSLIGKRGGR